MAGSLIKIDEEIVSSAVASVTLGGSDWDNSYAVYMVKMNNVTRDSGNGHILLRVTASGTPDTSANYDRARKQLRADTTFGNSTATNETFTYVGQSIAPTTNYETNIIMYLYNFNNSNEYCFGTIEESAYRGFLIANQGGWVHTVAQSCDGVQFFSESGNIASGTFTLYGLKK